VTDSAYANLDESLREVLTVAARSSKVAPESAAGPRGPILTNAELQCLSYSQQRVRLCRLDQLCDCQALGFHLRQYPLARRS
jgi:hypothetical protein